MMKLILFICFIPIILTSPYREVYIRSDEDCWSNENNKTIEKNYAALVKFSPKIAYGKDSCSVHIINPYSTNIQNGIGLFLSQEMDCASIVTVECLPDHLLSNQMTSVQFTCHSSKKKVEMSCNGISLTFKRDIKVQEIKKTTAVQVVALVKEPCDSELFFRCSKDYNNSCIDQRLHCNGRSECPNGDDELGCDPAHPEGIPLTVIVLIVLGLLLLICISSSVLICCCCRAACNRIIRRFRSKRGNKSLEKGDVTVTGEDAGLMKSLTAPATIVELPRQYPAEPAPLIIDSTKPVYPRLE